MTWQSKYEKRKMMENNVRIEVWGMGENKIFEMRAINDADKREFVKESVDECGG